MAIGAKNQVNRSRGETLGEAGANEPFGFERKPQLDEQHKPYPHLGGEGLRGEDQRQGDLEDAATRVESGDVFLGEQRTAHQDAQQGADVRAPFVEVADELPEGLQRERTHPLNPTDGRSKKLPGHVPNSPPVLRHRMTGH